MKSNGLLSKRQAEVAAYLAHGYSNKEIQDLIFVCEKTVKFHATFIYKKLGVKSKSKLVAAWHTKTLKPEHIEKMQPFADKISGPVKQKPVEPTAQEQIDQMKLYIQQLLSEAAQSRLPLGSK